MMPESLDNPYGSNDYTKDILIKEYEIFICDNSKPPQLEIIKRCGYNFLRLCHDKAANNISEKMPFFWIQSRQDTGSLPFTLPKEICSYILEICMQPLKLNWACPGLSSRFNEFKWFQQLEISQEVKSYNEIMSWKYVDQLTFYEMNMMISFKKLNNESAI